MTQGSDTVAEHLRALAATRWIDRSDEATRAALTEGAAEVERLTRALDTERDTLAFHVGLADDALRDLCAVCDALGARAKRSDPLPAVAEMVEAAQALRARAEAPALEVDALQAVARGAQYREREALAQVDVLRAALDRALDERDEAENRVENLEIARTIGPRVDEVRRALAQGDPGDPTERCPIGTYAATVLGYGAQPVGDLAGLGARAAGAVTVGEGEGR